MHKGVILLVKANNKNKAQEKAEEFLKEYEGGVWDWYTIGGRWSGTLNNNCKKFLEIIDQKWPVDDSKIGRTYNWVEENLVEFQNIWESLGETSKNPYARDTFISHNYDEQFKDDIMKAIKCETVIKSWFKDMKLEAEKYWKKAEEERDKEKNGGYPMSGYYARLYNDCIGDYFSFESSVFDVENYTHSLPEDLTDYFAVMIDMHN